MKLQMRQFPHALQHRARADYATGDGSHAEGVIVGYADRPTFIIVTDEGRTVPWLAALTDVDLEAGPVSDEEYYRHANARRIRDGRDSVRPELRGELPQVTVGMSLASIVDAVVAAGYDLGRVSIEYAGCGSHDILLEEDVRSDQEIADSLAEQQLRAEYEAARVRAAEQRAAEAEAIDADPTKGWD